jgi:hypothetical protein
MDKIFKKICLLTFTLVIANLLNSCGASDPIIYKNFQEILKSYKTYDEAVDNVNFSGGEGTKSSPYIIASANDLINLSKMMRPGNRERRYANAYYMQTKDVDLGGMVWAPIGFYDEDRDISRIGEDAFSGSYDGRGHEIRNMRIDIDEFAFSNTFKHSLAQGLFGSVSYQDNPDVGIRNIVLSDATIVYIDDDMPWHQNMCGGLVGIICSNNVSVENCTVTDIRIKTSANSTGMLVGKNQGKISDCHAKGKIDYTVFDAYVRVGGALGLNTGQAFNCESNCDIILTVQPVTTDDIEMWAGGFVGQNGSDELESYQSKIDRSSAVGTLSMTSKKKIVLFAGSFAGESWETAPISNSSTYFIDAQSGKEYPFIGSTKKQMSSI